MAISEPSKVDKNSTESCGTKAAFYNSHNHIWNISIWILEVPTDAVFTMTVHKLQDNTAQITISWLAETTEMAECWEAMARKQNST